MNNEQNNNNKNLNSKNNKWRNVLIGIIVVIVIFLSALTIYVVIDKEDNNDKNDNNQQNINNQHGKDTVFSYTKEQTKQFVYDFPYSRILETEKTYQELWYTYITKEIFENMDSTETTIYSEENERDKYEDALNKEDSNGKTYPKYEFGSAEHVYMLLGLTVDEISKKELDLNLFCGGCTVRVIDGKKFKNEVQKVYGNVDLMFDKSFELIQSDVEEEMPTNTYYYDKGMDKVFAITRGGGMQIIPVRKVEILNEKEENNEYKIEFVEGYFICNQFDDCSKVNLKKSNLLEEIIDVYNNSNKYIIDENFKTEYKNILNKNKEKLNKYEVTFEKTSNGYSYKSIKKI